ncbi:MAG: hypothetical protein GY816_14640 [Cytophagales bacterium]|nr:hypothetical protein [Cytophagales bacterium]
MTCWICNNAEASTKEHIIKKSDIKRAFGGGSYNGDNAPVHVKKGTIKPIQGANSKFLKYSESLCQYCNGAFTQPFDFAYDIFIEFVYENESSILRKRCIDFTEIYGEKCEDGLVNLYKYFAKSFGCRLVDAGEPVPNDVRELLYEKTFKTGLRLSFSVNEDILILPSEHRDGFIGKGGLLAWLDKDHNGKAIGYQWSEHVSWLLVSFWYNVHPDGNLGSTWVADNQFVYLGCTLPLNDEQREYGKNKVKELSNTPVKRNAK